MSTLNDFLNCHAPFATWNDTWVGVPLAFRVCLGNELPPKESIGSVRGIVLRGSDVLVVYDPRPILSVGGRGEPGESVRETLLREVAEETGWHVQPIGIIGFVHARHTDEQRPNWRRPAPDFIEPFFAVEAERYDAAALGTDENRSEFVPVSSIDDLGVDAVNRTLLDAALRVARPETQ